MEKIFKEVQQSPTTKNNTADVRVNVIVNVFSWARTFFGGFSLGNKTIYWTECCENQYFFTKNGEFLCSWHTDNARYREDMKPLFTKLGIKIQRVEPTYRKIAKFVKNDLAGQGFHEDNIH